MPHSLFYYCEVLRIYHSKLKQLNDVHWSWMSHITWAKRLKMLLE